MVSSLGTRPFARRRKGLGMCPHSSCLQLCVGNWQLVAIPSILLLSTSLFLPSTFTTCLGVTQHSTTICVTGDTESLEEKKCHWPSTTLISQVSIPTWGQIECRHIPRPFRLVPRLIDYIYVYNRSCVTMDISKF